MEKVSSALANLLSPQTQPVRNHITLGLLLQVSSVLRFSLKFLSITFLRGIGGCNKLFPVWDVDVFWLSALFQVAGAERPCGTCKSCALHQPCLNLCGRGVTALQHNSNAREADAKF